MKSELTPDQLTEVANQLRDTKDNIYDVVERVTGSALDDAEDVFDDLKVHEHLFMCEECNEWKPVNEESDWRENVCKRCADST